MPSIPHHRHTFASSRWLTVVLAVAVTALGGRLEGSETEGARNQGPGEYDVKAGFLYNFALFVRWPDAAFEGPEDPLIFAVVGNDPFGKVLDETLGARRVHDRSIEIRRFRRASDVGPCHVLFVPRTEVASMPRILKEVGDRAVLLIGEHEGFAAQGGVINFYIEKKRVRFEINPEAAKQRDLRVSSKLLRLARIVTMGDAAGERAPE